MTKPRSCSILLLDDDISILKGLSQFLSNVLHHQVSAYSHPAKAIHALKKSPPDILICDLRMPDMDGQTVIKKIKELPGPHPEIIIITGHGEKANAIECLKLGAVDFLEKPFTLETFRESVDRVVHFIHDREQVVTRIRVKPATLKRDDAAQREFIGNSKGIRDIRNLISKIAATNDTSVLVTGETGTGKEIISRQIHFQSHRRTHPFYVKNCATVPEYLFESEFFGHVKGAFTNAISDHKGWFEIAHDSTLLLDEISTIPIPIQPKLLRVLEEKCVNRVGSSVNIPLNIRVIAASNNDLREMCILQQFRSDLYYRLNIFSIHVPPLRERKDDIPLLFDHFLALSAQQHQKKQLEPGPSVYEMLQNYPFPGNVRELKNIADKLTIIADDLHNPADLLNTLLSSQIPERNTHTPVSKSISQQETDLILKALKESGNVVAKAARILEISDQSLMRRMKKYGISLSN